MTNGTEMPYDGECSCHIMYILYNLLEIMLLSSSFSHAFASKRSWVLFSIFVEKRFVL